MSQIVERPLKSNHICPCGYGVLTDDIPLGTIYRLDLGTIRGGYRFHCGGCGTWHNDVRAVYANEPKRPYMPMSPVPYDLFCEVN